MQKNNKGQYTCSPSDLVSYLGCQHTSFLERGRIEKLVQKPEDDGTSELFKEKGIEHETDYLQQLKDEGKRVEEIPDGFNIEERAEQTLQAMRGGADVIYQAVLLSPPKEGDKIGWRGDADFLIKQEQASGLGDHSYEVLDTKLAQNSETKHVMQLCVYSELLADIQGVRPEYMHLYLGSKERSTFKVSEYYAYYTRAKKGFERHVSNMPEVSYPQPCSHCSQCSWKAHCETQWEQDNHLSLVAGISKKQIDRFNAEGILSVADLSKTKADKSIPDLNRVQFERLRAQAILQNKKAESGEDICEIIDCPGGSGFERMPGPDEGDLFFDMEGDPLHPDGLEYLFGIHYIRDGKDHFLPFWAHSHEEEKKIFIEFIGFLKKHLKKHPDAYIYHYNHYETSALKRLACRYAICEEDLDNLLRQEKFIDLFKVVRENIRTSEPSLSLKNLETFYMEKRSDAVTSATESIVIYNEWRKTKDPQLLEDIADYNKVDCESTQLLRDWLLTLRPEGTPWFELQAREPEENAEERREWEKEYEQYQELLGLHKEDPSEIAERHAHLLEFHRREQKSYWWAMFDRQGRPVEDLIDDAECLAGLQLLEDPYQDKRSLVYTYGFPPQEHKFRVGEQPTDIRLGGRAGAIMEINETRNTVSLRRGEKMEPLAKGLMLGPPLPINTKILRSAIYESADDTIVTEKGNSELSKVAYEILGCHLPRFGDRESDKAIIDPDSDTPLQDQAMDVVSELNNSYLLIQGPPGAGKTYTSSRIIVGLINQGKKVGVSSNSHKAINNLLHAVVDAALLHNIHFKGIKKSGNKGDSKFNGQFITNEGTTSEIDLSADLFAGTAWTFAHEHFEDALDYLFIDEAGQVSSANVVAMSHAAKNIVLVGDQMQLGQPTQGTHPGDAGLSVLEFLLKDHATIPTERGIFLGETYRMRKSICNFISDAFYDGRLQSNESTEQNRLTLKKSKIPEEGIVYIPAQHDGCSQKSEEEGDIIKKLYQQLLGESYTRKDGTTNPISEEDILVVTPYNMQVDYLSSCLPKDARVGTVDKFQGQEAPIVIVSMTTSSAEYMPRGMDFLYSRQRLNVALSRAQCLAVIVMNPQLMEVPCNTPQQLKLVNTFCQLGDYATLVSPSDLSPPKVKGS